MAFAAEDIVDYIDANIASLTAGTNLFIGPTRQVSELFPSEAVFVLPTGGFAPDGFIGMDTQIWNFGIQVRVRWTKDFWRDGYELASEIRDLLHYSSISDSIDVRVNESEPNYIGEDSEGNPEWTINVTFERRQ